MVLALQTNHALTGMLIFDANPEPPTPGPPSMLLNSMPVSMLEMIGLSIRARLQTRSHRPPKVATSPPTAMPVPFPKEVLPATLGLMIWQPGGFTLMMAVRPVRLDTLMRAPR
ncbi:hypothetical protein [Arthrobacter sp. SD76]|uniref:hypothetical protein n=1 Tax=Arthrobacter sp. SD76 TaxID=3415007 RepID=UPI003C71DB68